MGQCRDADLLQRTGCINKVLPPLARKRERKESRKEGETELSPFHSAENDAAGENPAGPRLGRSSCPLAFGAWTPGARKGDDVCAATAGRREGWMDTGGTRLTRAGTRARASADSRARAPGPGSPSFPSPEVCAQSCPSTRPAGLVAMAGSAEARVTRMKELPAPETKFFLPGQCHCD